MTDIGSIWPTHVDVNVYDAIASTRGDYSNIESVRRAWHDVYNALEAIEERG